MNDPTSLPDIRPLLRQQLLDSGYTSDFVDELLDFAAAEAERIRWRSENRARIRAEIRALRTERDALRCALTKVVTYFSEGGNGEGWVLADAIDEAASLLTETPGDPQ